MVEKSVLLVCDDSRRGEELYVDIKPNLGGFSLQVETSSEVLELGVPAGISALLIDLRTVVGIGAILGLCEARFASVAVVAIDDRYDEAVALALFPQGITDYLSISDHLERFGVVIEAIDRAQASAQRSGSVEGSTSIFSHS